MTEVYQDSRLVQVLGLPHHFNIFFPIGNDITDDIQVNNLITETCGSTMTITLIELRKVKPGGGVTQGTYVTVSQTTNRALCSVKML